MDVAQARKLKVLQCENARLNRLLADAMCDKAVLKVSAAKTSKACRSAEGCRACAAVVRHQQASGMLHLRLRSNVSALQARRIYNGDLRSRLDEIAAERPRFGYRWPGNMLAREGLVMYHKKRFGCSARRPAGQAPTWPQASDRHTCVDGASARVLIRGGVSTSSTTR